MRSEQSTAKQARLSLRSLASHASSHYGNTLRILHHPQLAQIAEQSTTISKAGREFPNPTILEPTWGPRPIPNQASSRCWSEEPGASACQALNVEGMSHPPNQGGIPIAKSCFFEFPNTRCTTKKFFEIDFWQPGGHFEFFFWQPVDAQALEIKFFAVLVLKKCQKTEEIFKKLVKIAICTSTCT